MDSGVYRPPRRRSIGGVRGAGQSDTGGDLLVLRVPAVVPLVAMAGGLLLLVPLVLALSAGRIGSPVLQGLVALVGLLLVGFAVDAAAVRVALGADGVAVRRGLRRSVLPWTAVRGIALVSDGGVPQLRVVGHDDQVMRVRAWGLRARHPDGEVEPAAAALPRFGAEHGVRIKVRTLATLPAPRG
jgi:hypothetical protein